MKEGRTSHVSNRDLLALTRRGQLALFSRNRKRAKKLPAPKARLIKSHIESCRECAKRLAAAYEVAEQEATVQADIAVGRALEKFIPILAPFPDAPSRREVSQVSARESVQADQRLSGIALDLDLK